MSYKLYVEGSKEPTTLEGKYILANDVTLPWEYQCSLMRLWLIGNEYGPLGAVWATHESDALDELVDADLGNSFLVDPADIADYRSGGTEEEPEYDLSYLGNAGEPADLHNAWIHEVILKGERDYKLLCAFAHAQGAGNDTLE